MITKHTIREVQFSDLRRVRALVMQTIEASFLDFYPRSALDQFRRCHDEEHIYRDALKGYSLVLEYRDEIVGTGTLYGSNIRRVFIAPPHQRMGFGRLLVERLEGRAMGEKTGWLHLSASLVARDFYDVLGYRVRKEGGIYIGDNQYLKYYEMIKSLDVAPGLQRIV